MPRAAAPPGLIGPGDARAEAAAGEHAGQHVHHQRDRGVRDVDSGADSSFVLAVQALRLVVMVAAAPPLVRLLAARA